MPAVAGPEVLPFAVDGIGRGGRPEGHTTEVERALAKANDPVRMRSCENLLTMGGRSGVVRRAPS